jgi:hypothetical protein
VELPDGVEVAVTGIFVFTVCPSRFIKQPLIARAIARLSRVADKILKEVRENTACNFSAVDTPTKSHPLFLSTVKNSSGQQFYYTLERLPGYPIIAPGLSQGQQPFSPAGSGNMETLLIR